jgi:transcription factor E
MLNKFLKDVVTIIVGKYAEPIVDLLNSKKHVNEFIIAKKLDITINQARNILYKLSDHGLVSSIRKKDKKKGWYTYFWKMEVIKSLEFLKNVRLKQMNNMNNQIKNRETKQFYICERCNIEVNEETALLYDFTCNECGEIFKIRDNAKILKELRKNLDKVKSEIKLIDEELEKETSKIEKIKMKTIEKEKETRKKARAKKRKLAKKTVKKAVKKKEKVKKKTKKKIKRLLKTVKKAVKKKKKQKKPIKKKKAKKKIKKKPAKKKVVKKKKKIVKKKKIIKKTAKKKTKKKKRR